MANKEISFVCPFFYLFLLPFCYQILWKFKKKLYLCSGNNSKIDIMTKKKTDLSPKQRIATLEKRIAAKVSPKSKVEDEQGKKLGSVTVRYKSLPSGELRLYLDVYRDGKRHCYFLKTLDPAKVVSLDNAGEENENAISEAEAKRLVFANDMKAGSDLTKKAAIYSKMLFSDFAKEYIAKAEKVGRSRTLIQSLKCVVDHVAAYRGEQVTLKDIDKEFCEGFLLYLANRQRAWGTNTLSKNTQAYYYRLFNMFLKTAAEDEKIAENPATRVNKTLKPKVIYDAKSVRAFLEVNELKAMMETPCRHEHTKMAYIFCCFCGLRFSDVSALTWGNIVTKSDGQYINIKMQKTKHSLEIPISDEAISWLPERGKAKDTDRIYKLPVANYANGVIKLWAKAAGVNKNLSFHTSRHTFATLELTAGADIYAISKLLGHTKVETTEIYTKVLDKKKRLSVNLLSNLING